MNVQRELLNTRIMSSTRKVNAAQRARARASLLRQSPSNTAVKSPAPPVAEADPLLTPSRAPSRGMPHNCIVVNLDLNFPDEERFFNTCYLEPCAMCNFPPFLYRSKDGYRMRCRCKIDFPLFKYSQDAVRHWRLIAKLSKP